MHAFTESHITFSEVALCSLLINEQSHLVDHSVYTFSVSFPLDLSPPNPQYTHSIESCSRLICASSSQGLYPLHGRLRSTICEGHCSFSHPHTSRTHLWSGFRPDPCEIKDVHIMEQRSVRAPVVTHMCSGPFFRSRCFAV